MLENHQNPSVQSPEHQSQPIVDEEISEALHLVDSAQIPENIQYSSRDESETRKKHPKGKKK